MIFFWRSQFWGQRTAFLVLAMIAIVLKGYSTTGFQVIQGNCTCNRTTGSGNSSIQPTSFPTNKAIRLKIAAFYSLTTAPFLKELVSALKVAIEMINKDPQYPVAFNYTIIDTGLNYRSCQQRAMDLDKDVDLIIGATRSFCNIAIARATQSKKLPIIAYSATSTALSNKANFPYVFRTCPSDEQQGKALAEIVRKYKWNKVGVVSANRSYAANLARVFENKIREHGVQIVTSQRVQVNITSTRPLVQYFEPLGFTSTINHTVIWPITARVKTGSAVNLMAVGPFLFGSRFAPAATKAGTTGPGWTWLMSDGVTFSDYSGPDEKNVRQALQGSVGVATKGGSGPVFDRFVSAWKQKDSKKFPGAVHSGGKPMTSSAQLYDAVLAYAVSLTSLYKQGNITKNTSRLVMRERLIESLKDVSFVGALGLRQSFDENGDGPATYDIKNYMGNKWVTIGFYDERKGLNLTSQNIVWSGGRLEPYTTELPTSGCGACNNNCDRLRKVVTWLSVGLGVATLLFVVLFIISMTHATKTKNRLEKGSVETTVFRNYPAENETSKDRPSNATNT